MHGHGQPFGRGGAVPGHGRDGRRLRCVAIARSLTNTFSGIRPVDLPGFIAAELCGAAIAAVLMGWLLRSEGEAASMKKETLA